MHKGNTHSLETQARTHTHTHTHTQREREREVWKEREKGERHREGGRKTGTWGSGEQEKTAHLPQ